VEDIRRWLEGEIDERLGPRKNRPVRSQKGFAGRQKTRIMGGKACVCNCLENDGAGQFDRQRLNREMIPCLIDGMIEGPFQRQLPPFPDMAARFSSKKKRFRAGG